jgi:uncharacterized membrane protein
VAFSGRERTSGRTARQKDLPAGRDQAPHGVPARVQLSVAGAVGVVTGVVAVLLGADYLAPLIGWCAAAVVYLAWVWTKIWPLGPERTARRAVRQDPGRASADVVLLGAATASLLAVGQALFKAGRSGGLAEWGPVGLAIAGVALSWGVVHTVYTLTYARLYYTGPDGGVEFNQDEPPRYTDFAYLSFTIGMTFQVSDTALTEPRIRATALRHALLSYLFGAVILAVTVNMVAGLSK